MIITEIQWVIVVYSFFLGALYCSSINCLFYRIARKESWVLTRSYCEKCKHTLTLWEVFPIIGALLLRGKCRYCGERFGFQYTLQEAGTGLLTAACVLGTFYYDDLLYIGILFLFSIALMVVSYFYNRLPKVS